jgi:hypothetical protein
MKRILIVAALSVGFAGSLESASQPQSLGVVTASTSTFTGGVGLWQRSAAQIAALTASTTGQIVYCTNCVTGRICVSTGTAAKSWVLVSSGTVNPCN